MAPRKANSVTVLRANVIFDFDTIVHPAEPVLICTEENSLKK
ncbi:hypothetical protein [Coleofasciculus sp. H7-2]